METAMNDSMNMAKDGHASIDVAARAAEMGMDYLAAREAENAARMFREAAYKAEEFAGVRARMAKDRRIEGNQND